MAAVSSARANALLMGVMAFAQLLLMAASVRGSLVSGGAAGAVGAASEPVVRAERSISGVALDVVHFFRDIHADAVESAKLRLELTRLSSELDRVHDLAQENERLRELLGMHEDLVPKSIGASVVTSRLANQSRVLLVDRGSADGVRADMAVVAWGGAVGRVVSVDKGYARVRLLSDPNSGASGVIARSHAEGMVVGRGSEAMEMIYVPKYADVAVGDRVITSGLDGVFPRGFGLGRVTVVGEPVGASKSIRVEPLIDEAAVGHVLVLLESSGTKLLAPDETEAHP